jgi:hypothetical protein
MRRFGALVLSIGLAIMTPQQAHALATKPGVCLVAITLDFSSPVELSTSPTASIGTTLSGGGSTCAPIPTLDIPSGLLTTVSITNGSGSATVVKCAGIVAIGSYKLTFGDHFLDANGTWAFVGTPAGGELTLADLGLGFEGAAVLVPDTTAGANVGAISSCLVGSGMSTLKFVGALAFVAS